MRVPTGVKNASGIPRQLSANLRLLSGQNPRRSENLDPAGPRAPMIGQQMPAPLWYSSWFRFGLAVNDLPVFFVGGCQKSGTTWLQHLLNAHPVLCCDAEGHLLDLLAPAIQQVVTIYNQRQSQRPAARRALLSDRDLLGTVKMLGDQILAGYLAGCDDPQAIRAVGDKTPEHAVNLAVLAELYPQARFIHIIRDGRDACISGWFHLQRQGKAERFATLADYADYFAEHHWLRYITAARAAAASIPDRYLELRYESLHADPAEQTRRILRFLDVDAGDEVVADCVSAASFEKLAGGRARGQEDASSFFRKGVVGDWREHFDEQAVARFEQKAGDLLRSLGYAASESGRPRSVAFVAGSGAERVD